MDIFEEVGKIRIVPVVVLNDAEKAVPLAEALCKGGLPCAEVTFRTDAAEESIKRIAKARPDMLVGAGTVLSPEQADRAMAAGAKFIVSPGLNPKVVEHCLKNNYPVCPGIMTPTEIELAMSFGLERVKFFPAEQAGGLKMIKALAAPYTKLKFMPTGGLNAQNITEYLAYEKNFACGGSWMCAGKLVNENKFDEIEKLTAEAAALTK
ncbi:MAG: bifunctional 4-hydroxy-2-oxoglutarate aldolase/2-dehydro-3-deoxy-phosphogluconate aldolase [Treponema sp.]|nr:bifunctional 4-hydroxy-2-oxoglutarate aldolase/2-dehydro-3-deoxy-phosphogluconate aldolase [Treponema sp.]